MAVAEQMLLVHRRERIIVKPKMSIIEDHELVCLIVELPRWQVIAGPAAVEMIILPTAVEVVAEMLLQLGAPILHHLTPEGILVLL